MIWETTEQKENVIGITQGLQPTQLGSNSGVFHLQPYALQKAQQ